VCSVFLAAGCDSGTSDAPEDPLLGTWRAEITQFDKQVPFTLELARKSSDGSLVAYYINGAERVEVEHVVYDPAGGQLQLLFPSYSSGLTAVVTDESMTGQVSLQRRDGVRKLPFAAAFGATHRFFAEQADSYAELAGTWETTLQLEKPPRTIKAVATFQQQDADIRGTVRTRSGDYRFLTGTVKDQQLFLSTFDGQGSQLWLATLGEDGVLRGSFDTMTSGQSRWGARRNSDAQLEDPTTLTWLLPGHDELEFSFPDLSGAMVTLTDPQFENKVVLVVIAGSWCPSCHEEVQFMAPLYEEFKGQGLEVVYLMFEYSAEFDVVKDQILAYQKRYNIRHPILFAGDAATDTRNQALPMLSPIVAFPTTLFIDRRGKVRKIHTAFPGAATGAAHEKYKLETRAYVNTLVQEEPAKTNGL